MTRKKAALVCVLSGLVIAFSVLAFDSRMKTVFYAVDTEARASGIRIALVTDLHSCYYGEGQRVLVEEIEKQNPDMILLGGDICDDNLPWKNTETFLKEIQGKFPCYYVPGNHEHRTRQIDGILDLFEKYGVKVIAGMCETVEINGKTVNLCGSDDPAVKKYTNRDFDFLQQLDTLEKAAENGNYTILLSHRPEQIKSYVGKGFDLILCGHAHGGQWRIPGLINGLYAPQQGLFPAYAGGEYTFDGSKMIVSRGLARESTFLPRIFNRPELVIVDLR